MLGSGPGDRGSNLTLSFPKRKATVYPKKRNYKSSGVNENPRGAIFSF